MVKWLYPRRTSGRVRYNQINKILKLTTFSRKPIFPGTSTMNQLDRIIEVKSLVLCWFNMLLKFLDASTGYGKTRERRHCRRAISIRNHDACISSAPKAKESYRGRRIVGLLCTHCLNHLHCSFFHARVTRLQICCKSSSNSIPRNESRQRKR